MDIGYVREKIANALAGCTNVRTIGLKIVPIATAALIAVSATACYAGPQQPQTNPNHEPQQMAVEQGGSDQNPMNPADPGSPSDPAMQPTEQPNK
jgi:hypothetical protein